MGSLKSGNEQRKDNETQTDKGKKKQISCKCGHKWLTLFFFLLSVLITACITMIVPAFLKIGAFTDIDNTLPESMNLRNFSIGALSYTGNEFSVSKVMDIISANGTTNFGAFVVNDMYAYINGTLDVQHVAIGDWNVTLNQNNFSTWGIDPITLDGSLRVSGRLSTTAIRFGPFEIRNNVLTNNLSPAKLLEDDTITDFAIFGNFLAIFRHECMMVYLMNEKEISTRMIWQKFMESDIISVKSARNKVKVATQNGDFVFECQENGCFETETFHETRFTDAFGDTWNFDESSCTVSGPSGDVTIEGDCSDAKLGISEKFDVYVVVPKQNKVIMMHEDEEILLGRELRDVYHPVPYTSTVMFVENGRLQKLEF